MSSIRTIALAKAIGGGGGSSIEVESLSVSQNGTTTAPEGVAYNPVIVDVPNSYAAGDEGKVVSNGALVAQTSRTVTANNTYDTTLNNEMVVNVQPPLQQKTVNANGDVTPDEGYYGLSKVVVEVSGDIDIETLTVTENGTVVAPTGKAYGTVIVDVPARTPRSSGTSVYDIGAFLSDYDWRGAAALQTA